MPQFRFVIQISDCDEACLTPVRYFLEDRHDGLKVLDCLLKVSYLGQQSNIYLIFIQN